MTGDRFLGFVKCVVRKNGTNLQSLVQFNKQKTSWHLQEYMTCPRLQGSTNIYILLLWLPSNFMFHLDTSSAQKRDSWWRMGKNGLRHPQISKASWWRTVKSTMRSWHTLSGMSLNDEAAFEAGIYFTKACWHDMICEKTHLFLSEWSTFPEKNDSPATWGREYHNLHKRQILKQALETSSYHIFHFAIDISSHSCLMKTQRTT